MFDYSYRYDYSGPAWGVGLSYSLFWLLFRSLLWAGPRVNRNPNLLWGHAESEGLLKSEVLSDLPVGRPKQRTQPLTYNLSSVLGYAAKDEVRSNNLGQWDRHKINCMLVV